MSNCSFRVEELIAFGQRHLLFSQSHHDLRGYRHSPKTSTLEGRSANLSSWDQSYDAGNGLSCPPSSQEASEYTAGGAEYTFPHQS